MRSLGSSAVSLANDRECLIDIGSTTTDLIPLVDGRVAAHGSSDTERLLAGELVYTGVGRTPVCAVTASLPYRGRECPVAAEFFATTADAYLVLGEIEEHPEAIWTADGRPLTEAFARDRLARMLCADRTMFDENDARRAAAAIRTAQLALLGKAMQQVASPMSTPPEVLVVSGAGEFLARRLAEEAQLDCELISLASELGPAVSQCAPAHALAVLARERDMP